MTRSAPAVHSDPVLPLQEKHFVHLGWLVILGGLGVFLLWAALAPLDKGVVAQGTVMVTGHRKTVQSPASGVIAQIAVTEGQFVVAGETLVTLSRTEVMAQLAAVREQYATALMVEQRLRAERDGLNAFLLPAFPGDLAQQVDVHAIQQQQQQLLQSRRLALSNEIKGYQHVVDGLTDQLTALKRSRQGKVVELSLLRQQTASLRTLVADGFFPRNRYLDLQQQVAATQGGISETDGRLRELQRQVTEYQQRIIQSQADQQKDVQTQLEKIRTDLSEKRKKLALADFGLQQTTITAPQSGVVTGLTLFTPGGVVNTGEHLMEIVPQRVGVVVEAHLKVDLIDRVHKGLPVMLMFTAFNHISTPKVAGQVTLVSADRLTMKESNEPYYNVQIALTPQGMAALHRTEIKPGMPVEVFINTGERTLLNYLFRPLWDRIHSAFTEE